MELVVLVSPDKDVSFEGNGEGAAFATLEWKPETSQEGTEKQLGGQIMLQTAQSLSEELSLYSANSAPTPSGTIYFRGLDPEEIQKRAPQDIVVKGPIQQWYGMNELYLKDPDGYIICVGVPAGNAPQ
ncbi:hypothetical protein WH95_00655 [Kiloniella litopenaei]|uniref:VOC domain-containing protein n=2 Tax=Kiloniella litopenaei TaxID=1549748 RepID=A0A0M2RF45_9PROT|nr:hypothetical protein WH95_00655 [Kiloniella litopenaei]